MSVEHVEQHAWTNDSKASYESAAPQLHLLTRYVVRICLHAPLRVACPEAVSLIKLDWKGPD